MNSDKKIPGDFCSVWLKLSDEQTEKHQLFFKEHSVRNQGDEYPKGRTLFVLNIPPYVTAKALQAAFKRSCGIVLSVKLLPSLSEIGKGFSIAYVVFQRESSLDAACSLPPDFNLVLYTGGHTCITGIQKWCKAYNESIMQDEYKAKKEIEKYMIAYDQRKENEKLQDKKRQQDADGWTTVSSKKKRGQFAPSRKESTLKKLEIIKDANHKKKELLNFYTFQKREANKARLTELRKKFELDKVKLQELKSKRTFKPFG